ncbi:MAG: hypothetical protein JW748_04290 [Anaerolineales bacterium]|nr:hypothetical protein [Anaerolineales bacterium]
MAVSNEKWGGMLYFFIECIAAQTIIFDGMMWWMEGLSTVTQRREEDQIQIFLRIFAVFGSSFTGG